MEFKKSFRGNMSLGGAVEYFADELPIEWGKDLDDKNNIYNHSENSFFAEWKLNKTNWFEVEVFYDAGSNEWIGIVR